MAITEAAVRKVIKTTLQDISTQMQTADTFLQAAFAQAALPPPTPAALYDTIGTWLAAHFVAITDPRLENVRRTQYGAEWLGGDLGTGLLHTAWGQQACALDVTGTLAASDPTACMAQCGSGGLPGSKREARLLFV